MSASTADELNAVVYGGAPLVPVSKLMGITATLVVVIFVAKVTIQRVQVHVCGDTRDRVIERDVNWQSYIHATN